jgi:hypothetical protein
MEGAPWLLLSFARADELQAAAALQVSPPPSAQLRLFLLWERLAQPVAARGCLGAEVAALGRLARGGGPGPTVLEWGGLEVVRPR